jgi:hypothetical protein
MSAALIAGGTIGAGLLQGILTMESDKRRLAQEKAQFDIQQKEHRLDQQLQARQTQMQQPMINAQQNSQTLQGLIQALGGTR